MPATSHSLVFAERIRRKKRTKTFTDKNEQNERITNVILPRFDNLQTLCLPESFLTEPSNEERVQAQLHCTGENYKEGVQQLSL